MKKPSTILCALITAGLPLPTFAVDLYWDRNATAPGASSNPSGVWDSVTPNWNLDAAGVGNASTLVPWTNNNTAIFSAGNDASGTYTIDVEGTQAAEAVRIEEGTVALASGAVDIGTGTVTIGQNAGLSINSSTRLVGTSGSKVILDGGTLIQTNPSNALSFISANIGIEVGPLGGTVNYTSSGAGSVSIYTGLITGTGTLTKTGPNEVRYNGSSTNNRNATTYTKLVVNQGLFRLGSVAGFDTEVGFGAVPATFTPDAITLVNGASIGTSFNTTLDANRGITLGAGGGAIETAAGSMTIPGTVSGAGTFMKFGGGTVTFTGTNTYTGATNIPAGTLALGSATVGTGSILTTPVINMTNATLSLVNAGGIADRVGDATPINLNVGTISMGANAVTDATEATGVVTLGAGSNTISVASVASRITTLAPASIVRGAARPTALVRGTSLGQTVATNVARIIPADGGASLPLVGTNTLNNAATNDSTQGVRIIPFLFGDTSSAGTGNGFVTYDTALGLRVITAAQSAVLTPTYTTAAAPDNARITSSVTLNSGTPVTVNSLLFAGTAEAVLSATPASPLTVVSGAVATTGAFNYTIDASVGELALGNGEGVITVTTAANSLTINTPISVSDSGGLTKTGAGTLNLNVANTYTGPTTINAGVLQMNHPGALGANPNSTVTIAGRLIVGDGYTLNNPIVINANSGVAGRGLVEPISGVVTLNGPIQINANAVAGGHFAAPVAGSALVVNGPINAPAGVTVTSRIGSLLLSGGGNYNALQIQQDTVRIGANNGISTSAVVDVASSGSATLDLNGFNQTLGGLARTSATSGRDATVINNGPLVTLTLNVTGQAAFAGNLIGGTSTGGAVIGGEITLVKSGPGIQTLSGANPNFYTGSTTVTGGILKLQKGANTDTIPFGNGVAILSGGTLQLGQSSQINDDISEFTISNGTFDLGGFVEGVTPAITITNGTISGTSGGFLLARGGYITSGTNSITKSISVREFDPDSGRFNIAGGVTTVSGQIQTDDGSMQGITKTGAGKLVLAASNTYTGATTVSTGILEFSADQVLSSLNIAGGAVVEMSPDVIGAGPALASEAIAGAAPVQAVPEPGAIGLLAAGLLSLLGRRRRA